MRKQQGFMILIAVIFILVMGVMGTIIAFMFANRARVSAAVYNGMDAFYIAESGLGASTRYISRPSLSTSPTRVACGSITGHAQLTAASMSNGQFTATASAPSLVATTLSGGITSSATSLTVASAASLASRGRIVIDREVIDYAGKSGNTLLSLTRGADNTSASSHASSASVSQFQCNISSTGAVPSIASASYQRDLSWGVQLQDGWVVGDRQGNNYRIYRWNGNTELTWTNESFSAGGSSDRGDLYGVDMLDYAFGWAVGERANNGAIMLYWNGSSWSKSLFSSACNGQDFRSVSLVSSTEGWVVGLRYKAGCSGGGKKRRYTVLQWNGSSWSLLTPSSSPSIPNDHKDNRDLYGVHVIDTNGDGAGNVGFAVGDSGDVLQYNGSNWTAVSSSTSNDLRGVFVVSSSEAWAVGASGTIIRWNGSSWSTYSSPTSTQLNAISMLDTDNDGLAEFGVAVGENGLILTYNGSSWSSTTAGSNDLDAVAVLTTNDVWAAGQNGQLYHYDGSSWNASSISGQQNGIAFVTPRFKRQTGWQQSFR